MSRRGVTLLVLLGCFLLALSLDYSLTALENSSPFQDGPAFQENHSHPLPDLEIPELLPIQKPLLDFLFLPITFVLGLTIVLFKPLRSIMDVWRPNIPVPTKYSKSVTTFGDLRLFFFVIALIVITPALNSQEPENETAAPESEITSSLFHHVQDGTELELFPYVPVIELPFGMTVHLVMLGIVVSLVAGVFLSFSRKPFSKPGRMGLFLESIILFVRDDIVYSTMGKERGKKWLPFFLTLFTFILAANFLGLIPAFKSATGNLSVTSALALLVLILIFGIGFLKLGPLGFFKNLFPEGSPLAIGLFVAFLELISNIVKAVVLSLRLFANMFAGHLAILSFVVLMFVLNPAMGAIGIPFAIFTYALEVLVAFIQAFVFTLLSCIFITMASTSHSQHETESGQH